MGSTRILSADEEEHLASEEQLRKAAIPIGKEGSLLGDYEIIKKLGEGAMGAVYLARQPAFDNRLVALKVLFPHIANNEKLVHRLHLEAEVMFSLDHANIVKSLGVDEYEGWHFVAMEYVDGESLQKWINRLGKMSVPDSVSVTISCALALEHAHAQGMIHRDIKPDNVLIAKSGKVKVTDLGMVKKLEADEEKGLTMTGHAVGTPWYMPLEQAKNAKDADARCDIYSLGCMLYCMLTGHPPFTGHTIVEVIQAKEKGTFAPARSANADVPEQLDLIIAKMTQKLPKYRYQNCAELITDLENLQLASDKLEFLLEKKGKKSSDTRATSSAMLATATSSDSGQDTDGDRWFIRMKNADGQSIIKTMLTPQMMKMVEEGTLRPSVQISRNSKDGYRALGSFKEFQSVAMQKTGKKGISQKTTEKRKLINQIVQQEIKREEKADKVVTNRDYWLEILWKGAAVAVGAGIVLYGLSYIITGLAGTR